MWYPEDDEEFYVSMDGELCKQSEREYYGEWSESTVPYPGEAMLSTGCFDKDGKEMWDRDIVEIDGGRLCKIVWLAGSYANGWDLSAINSKGNPPGKRIWDPDKITQVGNVMENPELMEEK
jgi:hypothetical protein